jgi:hypothetical protein
MKLDGKRLWLWGSAAAAVAVAPLLLRASPDQKELFKASKTSIEGLTKSERERLNRNFEDFLKLSPEEQQQYRDFHAALERDRREGQGHYQQLLDDYYAWLKTVPERRQELLATRDAEQRAELVSEVVREQKERASGGAPTLSPEGLSAVMQILEGSLVRSQAQRAELEALSGIERHFRFLEMIKADRSERSGPPAPPLRGASDGDVERAISAIPDATLRDWVRKLDVQVPEGMPRPSDADTRRFRLAMALRGALQREFWEHTRRRWRPKDEDLRKMFDGLPEPERKEMLALTPAEFRSSLLDRYAATHQRLDHDTLTTVLPLPWDRRRGRGQFNRPPGGPSEERSRGEDGDRRGGERPPPER